MRYSLVIPYYNGSRYISETIQSVMSQTYERLDVYVINDCSDQYNTEFLENLLAEIDSDTLVYICNERNIGLMASLNKISRLIKTSYFFVLGQDDLIKNDHVASFDEFVRKITPSVSKDVSLVFCDAKYMYGDALTTISVRGDKLDKFRKDSLLGYLDLMDWNYVVSTGCLINTKCLFSIGGFSTIYRNHGEWLTWLELSRQGVVAFNETVHSIYRRHEQNITNSLFYDEFSATYQYYKFVNRVAHKGAPGHILKHFLYVRNLLKNYLQLIYKKRFKRSSESSGRS